MRSAAGHCYNATDTSIWMPTPAHENDEPKTITRLGVLHTDPEDLNPAESLEAALKKLKETGEDFSSCLIVVPEAFNFRGEYNNLHDPRRKLDPKIEDCRETDVRLRRLSQEFRVAFVAGLITGELGNGFNEAHLIDGPKLELLSRKRQIDSSSSYKPDPRYPATVCDWRGISIGVLICKDAEHDRQWYQLSLLELMKTKEHPVLCIPSRFSGEGRTRYVAEDVWKRHDFPIAVASASTEPSVIQINENQTVCPSTEPEPIKFMDLP